MKKLIIVVVIGIVIGALITSVAFYAFYRPYLATPTTTPATLSPYTPPPSYTPPEKIKAAFIYVGPIGDYGWSHAHEVGRQVVQSLFADWLITDKKEFVTKEATASVIDDFVREGFNVIFTTSFDHMDPTYEKASQYPNVMFFHCSGYKRAPNMATYFADLYQIYYLNGLIAGAVTKTGKLGYVAAHTIPEVVRHINAFAIGAIEMGRLLGKNITVYVIEIGYWYAPDLARDAAETLVEKYDVDVIAFTEDSTAIVEYAQALYRETCAKDQCKLVYVFSHYSPMYVYGPDVVISGQLVRWEVIYIDILAKVKAGIYRPNNLENVDYWYLLNTGAVELGAHIYEDGSVMMINPKFEKMLKEIKVVDPGIGAEVSVYDYVMKRYWQMKNAPLLQSLQGTAPTHKYESIKTVKIDIPAIPIHIVAPTFDPFEGPLEGYCLKGGAEAYSRFCMNMPVGAGVRVSPGVRLAHEDLWNMDWFVKGVVYMGKM